MNLRAAALLLLVSGAALSTGCDNSDDNGNPGSNKYTLTVTLSVPSGYEAADMPEMSVTATNSDKDLTYTETLAAGGSSVTFEVSSGQYQVTATGQFSNTITFTGATTADVFADKAGFAGIRQFRQLFSELFNLFVRRNNRHQIRFRHIAVILRLFLAAHGQRDTASVIPCARFLNEYAAVFQNFVLAFDFVF